MVRLAPFVVGLRCLECSHIYSSHVGGTLEEAERHRYAKTFAVLACTRCAMRPCVVSAGTRFGKIGPLNRLCERIPMTQASCMRNKPVEADTLHFEHLLLSEDMCASTARHPGHRSGLCNALCELVVSLVDVAVAIDKSGIAHHVQFPQDTLHRTGIALHRRYGSADKSAIAQYLGHTEPGAGA